MPPSTILSHDALVGHSNNSLAVVTVVLHCNNSFYTTSINPSIHSTTSIIYDNFLEEASYSKTRWPTWKDHLSIGIASKVTLVLVQTFKAVTLPFRCCHITAYNIYGFTHQINSQFPTFNAKYTISYENYEK